MEEPWRESRAIQSRPEAIARTSEVLLRSGCVKTGIDAAEQYGKVRDDDVGKRFSFGRRDLRGCRLRRQTASHQQRATSNAASAASEVEGQSADVLPRASFGHQRIDEIG